MIKEPGLPQRSIWLFRKSNRHCAFKPFYPISQNEVVITANEQVQVIWHNYISDNRDVELRNASVGVAKQSFLDNCKRGKLLSV